MKPPHLTQHPPPPPHMAAPDYDTAAAGSIYSVKGGGGGGRGIYDVSLYPPPGPPNQVSAHYYIKNCAILRRKNEKNSRNSWVNGVNNTT